MPMTADENWSTQMKKGMLELCILNLLRRESLYGYALVKRLTAYPGLVITEGTVYPLLSRLRKDGLIESSLVASESGPARRVYLLTRAGRRQLESMNEAWRSISRTVNGLIEGVRPDEGETRVE